MHHSLFKRLSIKEQKKLLKIDYLDAKKMAMIRNLNNTIESVEAVHVIK